MSLHYDPARGFYTTQIPPGTAVLRSEIAKRFGYTRTEVIRDKSRCQDTPSEHCECRAIDFFTTDVTKGRRLFDWLVSNAEDLGVQSVIFNRRAWGFGNWNERPYTGPSPHTDHVHVGLTRQASVNLTREQVVAKFPQEGAFMALTDAEQKELLTKTRALYAFAFGTTPAAVDKEIPRGPIKSLVDLAIAWSNKLGVPWK